MINDTFYYEDTEFMYATYFDLQRMGIKHIWDNGVIEINNGDKYRLISEDGIFELITKKDQAMKR